MIPPQNQRDETAVLDQKNARFVLYLALALAIILTFILVTSHILFNPNAQSFSLGPVNLSLIIGAYLSLLLIWRKKIMLGTGLLAAMFFMGLGYGFSQMSGLGIASVINTTILIAILFGYSWPRRTFTAGIITLAIVALIFLFADLYWPVSRPIAPNSLQIILASAAVLMFVAVLYLISRQFLTYSLRIKLLISFLAVTFASLSLLSVFSSRYTRNVLIDNANQILLTAASQTAVTLDDFYRNGKNDIRAEASIMGAAFDWGYFAGLTDEERNGPVGILAQEKAINLLSTYRDKDPINIASYALLDMDGQVLFEYPIRDEKLDESDWSYYKEVVKNGRSFVSPVEFHSETGEAFTHFSAIVIDNVGRQVGVLRARYKASVLQPLITRSTGLVGGQSFAVLFDENQLHLAHGTAPDTLFKLVAPLSDEKIASLQADRRLPQQPVAEMSLDLTQLAQNLDNAAAQQFFNAEDVATGERINQVAVAFMDEQPWQVAFFQPQDIFLEPVHIQNRRTVLLVLVISGVVAATAIWAAYFLTRPIIALEKIAAKVAEGDLTAHASVETEDEVGALAYTFNLMTAQIRQLIGDLEKRVADRTRALEISGDVSRQISTILDPQELVKTVVERVKQSFDYYHAHIYLFNETRERLIMAGGTGEAGQIMLAGKHQIEAGKGLVGRAGQTKQAVLVPDTDQETGWLPNPLLPDTKAEVAVPIISGDQVFGVLDVQHNVVEGLTQADADLLQSVANQVAIALRNARLYEELQQQAKRETLINDINQRILSTTNMQEAMQVAVRELGRATGASQTSVQLIASDNNGRTQHDA